LTEGSCRKQAGQKEPQRLIGLNKIEKLLNLFMGGSPPGLFFRLIWLSRKGNRKKIIAVGIPKEQTMCR
jgi:hypothetical protein